MNLSPAEIMVIALVALVVLGPTRLPEAARQLGRGYRQLLGIKDDFTKTMEEAAAPVREVKKTFEDSVSGVQKGIDDATEQAKSGFSTNGSDPDDTASVDTGSEPESDTDSAADTSTAAVTSTSTSTSTSSDDGDTEAAADTEAQTDADADAEIAEDSDTVTIARAKRGVRPRPTVDDDDDPWWERS